MLSTSIFKDQKNPWDYCYLIIQFVSKDCRKNMVIGLGNHLLSSPQVKCTDVYYPFIFDHIPQF